MRELEEDLATLADLAAIARDLWDDPSVLTPRDSWVNVEADEAIVGWAYAHNLLRDYTG